MARMKTSEIIEKARPYLWDGDLKTYGDKEEFLCHAIVRGNRGGRWDHRAPLAVEGRLIEVRSVIEERLHPYCTLDSWLLRRAGVAMKDLTSSNVQKHRWQWMEKLIVEFKRKGD